MKTLKLPKGHEALVDDEDYDRLRHFHWFVKNGHALRLTSRAGGVKRSCIDLSHEVRCIPHGILILHANHDPLDNTKRNLFAKGLDTSKVCTGCDRVLPLEAFSEGRFVCRACRNQQERQKLAENGDYIRERDRKRYARNPQRKREAAKKFGWAKKYPFRNNIKNHRRRERILKSAADGMITETEWQEVLERYGRRCLRCGSTDAPLTMDHIIPIVAGGKLTVDNVQPLCQSCNSSKGPKTIDYRMESV
jgi:5-methylcytosine-specific restriction endonuclease McrA